ncbi:MAG: hypothetical protein QXG05_06440 [Nitrososphaerota archaeon]
MSEKDSRVYILSALAVFMIVLASVMWILHPIAQQQQFGELLGAELIAFAMLTYVYTRNSADEVKEFWIMAGTLALAFLLGLVFI